MKFVDVKNDIAFRKFFSETRKNRDHNFFYPEKSEELFKKTLNH